MSPAQIQMHSYLQIVKNYFDIGKNKSPLCQTLPSSSFCLCKWSPALNLLNNDGLMHSAAPHCTLTL